MKKGVLIISSIILVVFGATTFVKFRSSEASRPSDESGKTIAEKEKVRRFWELYHRATEYRISGKLREAADRYQQALALNDSHENSLYYLGNIYAELGEFGAAEKAWKRLVQVNPSSARAHFQLGDLYLTYEQDGLFNIDAAEAEFLRTLEINKEETGPLLRLGEVAVLRGDLPGALNYLNAVIGSNYRSVEAHFISGYIAWKEGNLQEAVARLRKAVEYSLPEKPVPEASAEGDTKTGRALGLMGGRNRQRLFETFLDGLHEVDESQLSRELQNRYRELDEFLDRIRKIVGHE